MMGRPPEAAPRWLRAAVEGALLGAFMLAACAATVAVEHPASALRGLVTLPVARRALVGLMMGVTAVCLIRSRAGRWSGAHLNPAVTLASWWLGWTPSRDVVPYLVGQTAGGAAGVGLAYALLGASLGDPSVRFAVTVPGPAGPWGAFAAEGLIAFGMMAMVVATTRIARWSAMTPWLSGSLVALYITVEAPWSGMSMNPARTIASAVWAREWAAWWVYLVAPCAGMLGAAIVVPRLVSAASADETARTRRHRSDMLRYDTTRRGTAG